MQTLFRFCKKAVSFKVFIFYVISFTLFTSVFSASALAQESKQIAAVREYSQPTSQTPTQSQTTTQIPTPKTGDAVTIVTSSGKQESGKVLSAQTDGQVTVQTSDGRTETGKVLGFVSCVTDPINCVSGSIGNLAGDIWSAFIGALSSAGGILDTVWGWLKGQILNIIMTIIYWLMRLVTAVFGFSIDVGQSSFVGSAFGPLKTAMGDTTVIDASTMRFNALTFSSMAIGGVYQNIPNTSVPEYLATEVQDNIFGVKPTYAQGVGTSSLGDGVRVIWSKIRDLALIAMTLVLIVMGFMIMFRKRLSPQASVTVMNSIPRVAIALVLITFSFAISGLFIDLSYVTVNIIRAYMNNAGPFSAFFQFLSAKLGGELIWFPVFALFTGASVIDWGTIMGFFTAGPIFTDLPGTVAGILLLFIPFTIISLVEILIRLTLFAVSIYLFWILIKNFAMMVVYTIFSPLFFIIGAIPGFETATINWMKRMLASALVFPIVLIFLYISLAFMLASSPVANLLGHLNSVFHGDIGDLRNLTDLDSIKAPPPVGANLLNISYLIGIGILFFATKVPQFIEKLFKIDSLDIRGGLGYGVIAAPVTVPASIMTSRGVKEGVQNYSSSSLPFRGIVGNVGKRLGFLQRNNSQGTGNVRPGSAGGGARPGAQRYKDWLQGRYGNQPPPAAPPASPPGGTPQPGGTPPAGGGTNAPQRPGTGPIATPPPSSGGGGTNAPQRPGTGPIATPPPSSGGTPPASRGSSSTRTPPKFKKRS